MRIAMLAPIAWRTPPRHYGPWERIVSLITEGFEEPFGLSVVESMACGTPVIAFNRGSMPEIIQSGIDGFLVKNLAGGL